MSVVFVFQLPAPEDPRPKKAAPAAAKKAAAKPVKKAAAAKPKGKK